MLPRGTDAGTTACIYTQYMRKRRRDSVGRFARWGGQEGETVEWWSVGDTEPRHIPDRPGQIGVRERERRGADAVFGDSTTGTRGFLGAACTRRGRAFLDWMLGVREGGCAGVEGRDDPMCEDGPPLDVCCFSLVGMADGGMLEFSAATHARSMDENQGPSEGANSSHDTPASMSDCVPNDWFQTTFES